METGQLSPLAAKMIFKWSIIRTAHDYSAASVALLRNMHFMDFLEALVHFHASRSESLPHVSRSESPPHASQTAPLSAPI